MKSGNTTPNPIKVSLLNDITPTSTSESDATNPVSPEIHDDSPPETSVKSDKIDRSTWRKQAGLAALSVMVGAFAPVALLATIFDLVDRGWMDGRFSPFGKIIRGFGAAEPDLVDGRVHRLACRIEVCIALLALLTLSLGWFRVGLPTCFVLFVLLAGEALGQPLLARLLAAKGRG